MYMPTRQEMWDRLGEEDLDVLVIGGGINGAGIARDAALRGLRVAVIEQKDLAYGTSSRSSKLVHGGLRYLEQLEFSLVFEAVSERRILLDIAPHLVNPLGFLFPVYKGSRRNLTTINAGMWVYEGLSLFRSPKRHRTLKKKDVEKEEPCLQTDNLKGAPLYYDCSTDDARLTLESALDATDNGAIVATWARCEGFVKNDSGRVVAVKVRNVFTDELKEVRAPAVINATGPWTDRTLSMSKDSDRELLRPTKGVHIVVDYDKLPVNNAVVCFHPEDERVLFAIPWGDRTYLGTTDTDYEGDPGDVYAVREDVDYLLEAARYYFPDWPLGDDDVISTWAGLRPLMKPQKADGESIDESAVSREHQIVVTDDGIITIAGGKLTTFRRMSAEVVDTAVKLLRLSGAIEGPLEKAETDHKPLPGAVNWPPDDDHERVVKEVLDIGGGYIEADTARLLANTYGMRAVQLARMVYREPELARRLAADRPEILAQVDYGVQNELAATVTDILIQRTQVFYRANDQGLGAAPLVAQRMQKLLGWDDATRDHHVAQFTHDVELSRRWRTVAASAPEEQATAE
jgi:glycerol-3-phosphate dehydrogenase